MDEEQQEVSSRTSGIVLMGTPHNSSESREFAKILANTISATDKTNDRVEKDLTPLSDLLKEQLEQFKGVATRHGYHIVFAHETLPTPLQGDGGVIVS